jgi:hypothetical protein
MACSQTLQLHFSLFARVWRRGGEGESKPCKMWKCVHINGRCIRLWLYVIMNESEGKWLRGCVFTDCVQHLTDLYCNDHVNNWRKHRQKLAQELGNCVSKRVSCERVLNETDQDEYSGWTLIQLFLSPHHSCLNTGQWPLYVQKLCFSKSEEDELSSSNHILQPPLPKTVLNFCLSERLSVCWIPKSRSDSRATDLGWSGG